MGCLGNVLWFLCGGFLGGLGWTLAGCLWCITVIGIPVGMQCFKIAGLAFFPFGKEVVYGDGRACGIRYLPCGGTYCFWLYFMCYNSWHTIRDTAF